MQSFCVTVTTGCASVIDPASTFIRDARVPTAIFRRPIVHRMTRRTIQSEQACMIGWVAVTTCTRSGKINELTTFMAALTSHTHMPTCQWKITAIMIEIRILPIGWVMTRGTIRAILTIMFIILLVTGITIGRRAYELSVYMTGLTGDFRMLAFQFEHREIVVELCRRPTLLCVAIHAAETVASVMRLILMMTGIAILNRHWEIAQPTRVEMTLITGKPHMLPLDPE